MKNALIATVLALISAYLADTISARVFTLGSVKVQPFYAIHLKGKKIEYNFDAPPEMQSCVVSLLPHFGYQPCWYVKRNTTKRIDE